MRRTVVARTFTNGPQALNVIYAYHTIGETQSSLLELQDLIAVAFQSGSRAFLNVWECVVAGVNPVLRVASFRASDSCTT